MTPKISISKLWFSNRNKAWTSTCWIIWNANRHFWR